MLNEHVKRFSTQVRSELIKQGLKIDARPKTNGENPVLPQIWLCNVCKLLVDRDYELSLINMQVAKLNNIPK